MSVFEIVYWAAFLFGLGYAVFGFIGLSAGGFDHDVGVDHDVDVGHGEIGHDAGHADAHASPVNALTIAAFSTGLGVLGLLGLKTMGLEPLVSLAFALIGGLVLASLFFLLIFRPLVRSQSNSAPDLETLLNAAAVVRVSIPPGGFGEVVLQAGGTEFLMPARAEGGEDIAVGQRVAVLRIAKGVAYVTPLDEEELGFRIRGELN